MSGPPSPIRLLVSDVDGTLVRKDKALGAATIVAARRFVAHGGQMTLISARPPSGILPLAAALGLDQPIGAFNGGTIVMPDGTVSTAHRLSADASRAAIEEIEAAGATRWAFADGRWFTSDDANPHTEHERLASMVEPVVGADFSALHGRIDKIVGVSDNPDEIERMRAAIVDRLGDDAQVSLSQTYYVDVTHPKANKGDGIAALADAIGVPLSETAAIGDMPNDLPMLGRAGLPIAMGNAPDRVKDAARQIVASNDEDGVADAIDRLLMPDADRRT